MNESLFFQDLAVLMTVVGFVSVIFTRLHWPKVIGYLFAGILMSEHTWGGSFLADPKSIGTIGQLGIVFLMFTLGLEFSAGDMKKVRHVTIPTAIFDTTVMIWLGYTVGTRIMGWNTVSSLFLGAAICDSATTLLAKTIDEMNWRNRPFVRYIFGTTIFEDILCIGIIALITGVASGKGMNFTDVGLSLGGLFAFFTGVIMFGLLFVPRLLNSVAKLKDDETLILTFLGCCCFVSFIAFRFDYSLALGAFLTGILGASSDVRGRLLTLVAPLRNMFAAVFFVTIGLLVDPAACFRHAPLIAGLTLLVLLGKGFNCFLMSVLTGQHIKDAVQTGFGLAQIGEFAYMVALMYISQTNDISHPMYQIVVGVSLITTCLNPVLLRVSDPVGDWLENNLPGRLRGWISAYQAWLMRFRTARVPSQLQRHLHNRLIWIAVIAVLNLCICVMAGILDAFDYSEFSVFFNTHKRTFFCLAANLLCLANLAPLATQARSLGRDIAAVLTGTRNPKRWAAAVQRFVVWSVTTAVFVLGFIEILLLNVNLQPDEPIARLAVLIILVVTGLVGWKHFKRIGRVAGYRFNEAVQTEKRRALQSKKNANTLTLAVPDDFYTRIPLPAASPAIGQTIRALDIRARTGASIVAIEREGIKTRNPGALWAFKENDILSAIGEPEQLASLRELLTPTEKNPDLP
jgi:CPA2 family monovalent cation:H+ antiporter-2